MLRRGQSDEYLQAGDDLKFLSTSRARDEHASTRILRSTATKLATPEWSYLKAYWRVPRDCEGVHLSFRYKVTTPPCVVSPRYRCFRKGGRGNNRICGSQAQASRTSHTVLCFRTLFPTKSPCGPLLALYPRTYPSPRNGDHFDVSPFPAGPRSLQYCDIFNVPMLMRVSNLRWVSVRVS